MPVRKRKSKRIEIDDNIITEKKIVKTKLTEGENRTNNRGHSFVFCEDIGSAILKLEMPDGTTKELMTINTDANGDISRISIRVKTSIISKDKIKIKKTN